MVLDVVHLGGEPFDAERLRERRPDVAHLGGVLEPLLEVARRGAVADRPHELAAEVRARVARDRDVVDVLRLQAGVVEAPAGGESREPGAVLDAVEPLFLGGGDELTIHDEGRGGVAVVRVEAEDRRHATMVVTSPDRTGGGPPRCRRRVRPPAPPGRCRSRT
jgi:hypothetical protein